MKNKIRNRIASGLLAFVMGVSSFSGAAVTAFADDVPEDNGVTLSGIDLDEDETVSENADDSTSNANNESFEVTVPDDNGNSKETSVDEEAPISTETPASDSDATTNESDASVDSDATASDKAQQFVDAVSMLDLDGAVQKVNDYMLAQNKQMTDWNSDELAAATEKAYEEMTALTGPIDKADNLYYELTEDEQNEPAVIEARAKLDDCYQRMDYAMQHPTDSSDTKDITDVNIDELYDNLYYELPDKPTGYYIDNDGMPVAIGDTKISISRFNDGGDSENYRLESLPLNNDNLDETVSLIKGENYALVPILGQIEYPSDGSNFSIDF